MEINKFVLVITSSLLCECVFNVCVIFEAQHDDWNHPETRVSMATKAGESARVGSECGL